MKFQTKQKYFTRTANENLQLFVYQSKYRSCTSNFFHFNVKLSTHDIEFYYYALISHLYKLVTKLSMDVYSITNNSNWTKGNVNRSIWPSWGDDLPFNQRSPNTYDNFNSFTHFSTLSDKMKYYPSFSPVVVGYTRVKLTIRWYL